MGKIQIVGNSTDKGNKFQGNKQSGGIHVKRDLNETNYPTVTYGCYLDSQTIK